MAGMYGGGVARKGPSTTQGSSTDVFRELGEAMRRIPEGVKEQYIRVLDGQERNPAISAEDNKHANQMLERAFAHQLDDAKVRSRDGMHFEASRRFIKLVDLAIALEHPQSEIAFLRTNAVKELIRTADRVIEVGNGSLIGVDGFLQEAREQIAKAHPERTSKSAEGAKATPSGT